MYTSGVSSNAQGCRLTPLSSFLFLALFLVTPGTLHAATGTIILVTDTPNLESGGQNLAGYLQGLGYQVTVDPGNGAGAGPSAYRTLDATKIAFLESFDLVIVHRTLNSGDFDEAPEPTQWNSLDVPLLLGSAYLARNNPIRWDWLAGAQARSTVTGLTLVDPLHPIVNGLGTDLFNRQVDVDYVSAASPGNGTLVANVNNTGAAIVVWDEPGFFFGAAGQSHTARRVFFPLMRYYETDLNIYPGVFSDYSANGLQLLANAVAYAMNGDVGPSAPAIVDLAPADGTVNHPAGNGLSFRVTSDQPIAIEGISLRLNEVDVSAQLQVAGDETNRLVTFDDLLANTAYDGLITVSNALGERSLAFAFDTFPPDVTAPTIVLVEPSPGIVSSLTSITVTFSEPVTGVGATDLLVKGVPATGLTGSGAVYTFMFDPPPFGSVAISWDVSTVITDLAPAANAFDPNGAGATWSYEFQDSEPPIVLGVSPFPDATVRSLSQITVTFSEAVTGVDAGDLLINDTPASSVSGSLAGPYTFLVPPQGAGLVQVEWAAGHNIQDTAPSPNALVGESWSYVLNPDLEPPDIRLNEILCATLSTNQFKDEDGELQDWIELYNHGASPVNLAGWSLTDDIDDPDRWIFPAVTLDPNQYRIVFASGKDRRPTAPGAALHANFQLSSDGEFVALYTADVPPVAVSVLNYPEQRNDISFGVDTAESLRYFSTPTPGGPNGDSSIAGVVPPVHFNVDAGYFEAPFTLYLSSTEPGAEIRFTTDGSVPTASTGQSYEGPFQISGTRVVRAAAFKVNRLSSRTVTKTYLFLDQVLRQPPNPPGYPSTWGTGSQLSPVPADYEMDPEIVTNAAYSASMLAALKSLPSLSVVTSIDALFGPENGIYSHTTENQSLYRGVAWERPCSIEFLPTDGTGVFQADCGIRIQGNASREPRKTPKHPFRLLFKGAYGGGRLEEAVYPDSPARSFNTLVLRADFNNSWLHWDAGQRMRGTRIRDAWAKDTWLAMGQVGSHSRYFHLYLNGLYWGIYDFGERIDSSFASNYLGGTREDYDAIASKPTQAVDGDILAYNAMVAAIRNNNLSVQANYEAVLNHLDVDNFADYMLLNFYGANQDWGNDSNWNAVRRRSPDGRFKYVCWDGEQLLVNVGDNRVSNTDVPGGLHTSLVNSPEYRVTFGDRVHKHFFNNGALTTNQVLQRWMDRANEVDLAMIAESARWGDYRRDVHPHSSGPYLFYTHDDFWDLEINRLATSYFPQRRDIVLNQLRAAGLYPTVSAPVFNQHGGFAQSGFSLSMSASNQIYFTINGTDPRVFGTGALSPGAQLYSGPVVLTDSAVVKARALFNGQWSALTEASFTVVSLTLPVRFTEIMYNPTGGDPYEYLELHHIGGSAVNLGGYSMDGLTFAFPIGTILQPGQFIVLANNSSPAAFASRYPGVTVFGYYQGSLANGGERIALLDPNSQTIVSVTYDDEGGWPTAPDGQGPSLEIIDVHGSPDDPANWRASADGAGSPGSPSAPASIPVVRLNEVMADNASTITNQGLLSDWVELHNAGAAPVSLEGWSLSDGGDPRRYVFPAGASISAGAYLLVWCDTNVAGAGFHTGFALGAGGESVFLYNTTTQRIDAVTFGSQVPDFTVGRINDAWEFCDPTPGAPNAPASLAPASALVINEWMANPPPGQEDWLELYNTHATLPVSLQGLYLVTDTTSYLITSLSFIPPLGYERLWADESPGPNHLDLKLAAAGGSITLYDTEGAALDFIGYSAQTENVSEGRFPDGSAFIVAFPGTASPGAPNYADAYVGPFLTEIMARNASAVVGPNGDYPDWIELHNTDTDTFELSGMSLSDDPGQPGKWVFPAGSEILSGAYLVVWCDGSRPASTTATPTPNTGFSLSGDSGGVYLYNSAGQQVDWIEYGPQISDLSIGWTPEAWHLLANPSPGGPNTPAAALGSALDLRINEWMALPMDGEDWFELFNPDSLPVDLSGLYLTDDVSVAGRFNTQIGPLSFVGAQDFVRFEADGTPSDGRHHVRFNLNGQGESIRLYAHDGAVIDSVYLGAQIEGVSEGRFPDGSDTQISFDSTASPAASNYLRPVQAVINEVLTHSDPPLEDAVELYNPSGAPADIGGWFLSDSPANVKKFRVPDGTILPAGGYAVFYELDFNGGQGSLEPFTFNSFRGESIILAQATGAGALTGFRSVFEFGAAANGVSFGRYETTIGPHLPAMTERTFGEDNPQSLAEFQSGTGLPNASPRVGPIVISEVMYHPPEVSGQSESDLEFIELHNLSADAVALFDPNHPANTFRLRGGVEFDFPPSVAMDAKTYLLLVSFDPVNDPIALNAFVTAYGPLPGVGILGPFQGQLGNGMEVIQLFRPDPPQTSGPEAGFVPQVLVDEVHYRDDSPWPIEADGIGSSLQRRRPRDYANDPVNWKAQSPTPGRANVPNSTFTDTDQDGLPDDYELAHDLLPNEPADGALDADDDGVSNLDEFLDGTDPRDALSVLVKPTITMHPEDYEIQPGQSFTLNATATGTQPLTFQWRLNGRLLPGASSSSLHVPAAGKADSGIYTLVAMNAAGYAISDPASVRVLIPPRITQQPIGANLLPVGSDFVFSVLASGTGTLRYQWFLNHQPISGATEASLHLSNLQDRDSGQYSVLVSDDITSLQSNPAFLTVNALPVVLVPPQSQTVAVGDTVTFSVLSGGTLPMGYRWRRGFATVTNSSANAWTHYYTITNVQLTHGGNYSVILTNPAHTLPGVVSMPNAVLTVLADTDMDGLPDVFEDANGFLSNDPTDGGLDRDGDGASNRDEYRSGTDLMDPESYLKVETLDLDGGTALLTFFALAGHTYSIEYQDQLTGGAWQVLADVYARPANTEIVISDTSAPVNGQRYYRLVTPKFR